MKKFLLVLFMAFISIYTIGQNIGNYSFSTATNASLTDMSSGTSVLIPGPSDISASPITNIGFSFIFMGVPYTQFSANSDGQMRLGTTLIGTAYTVPSSGVPLLVPMSGNNAVLPSGKVHYKVTGTTPNQVLIVEWKDIRIPSGAVGNPSTIQVRIYEATGAIEYVYGSVNNNLAPAFTRAIWMSSSTAANTVKYIGSDLISAINSSTAVAFTMNDANTALLNSAADGARRIYTFTPGAAPSAPTLMTFTSVTSTSMFLNWVDNATNETGYAIYRSDNGGATYTYITTLAVNSVGYAATGLNSGFTYFWRVYAMNEGNWAYVQANQATSAAGTKTSAGSGNWSVAATWSPSGVPAATDNVVIADGHTVIIDAAATCRDLVVGQGVSGILRYGTTAVTLTVNNNLTVALGGTFDAGAPAGAFLTHTLNIGGATASSLGGGNLTVNGDFKMYIGAANGRASVNFYGINNAAISGTGANLDFNAVYLNKGAVTATPAITPPILDIQRAFTVQGVSTGGLITIHTSGVLKISGSFTQSNTLYTAVGYSIPASGGIWLNNANFTVTGLGGSPTSAGLFRITSGTYNIGIATGQSMALSSGSVIIIEGGAVNVAGRFAVPSAGNTTYYSQNAGVLTVQTYGHTSATYYGFDLGTGANSNFTMSGGSIVIVKGSATAGYDYRGPTAGGINITGGSVQFGNASSGATIIPFKMLGAAPTTVLSVATAAHTLTLAGNTKIYGDLSIPATATFSLGFFQLAMYGYSASYPGNITNAGTLTMNAGSASELFFGGIWGNQSLTNTGTITGSAVPKLTIANFSSPVATVTVPSITVKDGTSLSGTLTLTMGTLASSGTLTLGGGAGTGGFTLIRTNGSLAALPTFDIGTGTISYTYNGTSAQTTGVELPALVSTLIINNPWGVTLNSALSINNVTSTIGVLTLTSGVLTLSGSLTMGGGAATAFTFTATNGSISGSPTLNYGTGALAFTYNGTIAQSTGNELPALISTLTINNAAGVTLTRILQVGTTFTMTSGNLFIGTYNLTLGTAATSAATAGALAYSSGLVIPTTGNFIRWFTTTVLPPSVGTSVGYFPLGINSGGIPVNRQVQLAFSTATALSAGGTIAIGVTNDPSITTGLSIVDGVSGTITRRANSSWILTNTGCALSGTAIMRIQGTGALYTSAFANLHLMQSAGVVGTHSAGTGTNSNPQGNRTALVTTDLTGTYYIGAADADLSGIIYSAATGNWNAGASWVGGLVPTSADRVVISTGHNISVSDAEGALDVTVNSGGTLTIGTGANLTITGAATTGFLNNGTLIANAGTMTLGPVGGGNTTFTNNGTLTVSGTGTLNVNGNLSHSTTGTFNQSGGNINIDGNAGGVSANSVASGVYLLGMTTSTLTNINFTGGVLTIVDPHANATLTASLYLSGSLSGSLNVTSGHTIRFGDGISSDAGGNVGGFLINGWADLTGMPFGQMVVNGPTGTNRLVTGSYQQPILGDLIVNSGGECAISTSVSLNGNLTVNTGGILTSAGTLYMSYSAFVSGSSISVAPSSNAQSISGSGTFRNLSASSTANLSSLFIINSNTSGLTINTPLSVSGTLTLGLGDINTTASNLLTLGTATAAGTLSGGSVSSKIIGPFARTFQASRSASGTYTVATLYPVGKGSSYLPIWIDPTTTAVGPVVFSGEAFTSNTGSMGSGVTSLSANRWEALITSGSGNLTSSYLQLGDPGILSSNLILQAPSGSGAYGAIVPASLFTSATPNTLTTTGSQILAAAYNGYFAYGDLNPCSLPTAQPTALVASFITSTGFVGSFTAASPAPSNYLVVRYASGIVATPPVDYTTYAVAGTLGAGTIVYISTGTSFTQIGLTANTTYDYYVYSYNNSACYGPIYLTPSPLFGSITTCATATGAPGTPTATAVATTSFTANWTASSTLGVTYILDVATDVGFTTFVSGYQNKPLGVGVLFDAVTGLTAATTYYVRVRAVDGTCYSAYSGTLTQPTPCTAISSYPLNEGFESGYTDQLAVGGCWAQEKIGSYYWIANSSLTTYNRTPRTGSWDAYLNYSGDAWLFRNFTLTGGTSYDVSCWARQDGATVTDATIEIKYGTTGSSAGMTTTIVASTGLNATYANLSGSFTPATTGDYYVGIHGVINGTPWYITLDDIQVALTPSCTTPTALTATSVTSNSATIGWTPPSSAPANGYLYEVRTSGAAGSGATGLTTSGTTAAGVTSAAISALTANTTYSFYVKSDCGSGSTSSWTGASTFYTGYCIPAPLSVDNNGMTNVTFSTINNTPATLPVPGNYGDYSAMIGNVQQTATIPVAITFETGYTYDTKIWIDWNDNLLFTDAGEEVYVGVSLGTNPTTLAASFVVPGTVTLGNHRMRIGAVDAGPPTPCYTGTYGSYQDYTVNVTAPPACPTPTTLTATTITTTSANLGWTSTATAWEYAYGIAPFAEPSGLGTATTNNPTNVTGLTPGTTYDFYVRADCGGSGKSAWSAKGTFTTLCAQVTSFTQNFDGVTAPAFPNCWQKVGSSGSASTQGSSAASPPNCLYLYGYSGAKPVVAMPLVSNAGAGTHQLRFKLRANFTVGEAIEIGYMTDRTSDASFVAVTSVTASTLTYVESTVLLGTAPGLATTLAFRHPALLGNSCLIDDVVWEAIPTCPPPTSLAATNIMLTSADLGWTSTATAWEYAYGPAPFAEPSGSGTATTSNPKNITGLSPSTTYDFYVRSNCSGDYSPWSAKGTFTTQCATQDIPITQNFDAMAIPALPTCWSVETHTVAWRTTNLAVNNIPTHSSPNSVTTSYNASSAKNDWFFTPAYNLTAGVTYNLSFWYLTDGGYYGPEKMEVKYGTTATSAGMTSGLIWDNANMVNGSYVQATATFTPASTGVYYLGWHAYSDANIDFITVDDISLTGPTPTAYAVTGGGAYCVGGAGLPVGLANSETGVTYTLLKDGTPQVPTVAGTGAAISFGNQTAGTYTVSGQNSNGTTPMTGNAIITMDPVSVGGSIAPATVSITIGDPTGTLTLSGHTGTIVKWQKRVDAGSWSDIVNTAATYSETPLATGTYEYRAVVQSGVCTAENSAISTVTVNPAGAPIAYNVTGTGSYCTGGTGLTVTLSNSETGVTYQLYKNDVIEGSTVAGTTGSPLTWTNKIFGTYTVKGTNGYSITTTMIGSAIITMDPVSVGGSISPETATITLGQSTGVLTLSGHTGTILKWQSRFNSGTYADIVNTAATYSETPGATGVYDYRVEVKSGQCSSTYSNIATITVQPSGSLPSAFSVTGSGAYCSTGSGLPVGLANSETGVTYTLIKDGTPQVPTVAGTGSPISFGNQTVGTYTVSGQNGTGTTAMTGSAIITVTTALPVSVTIAPDENNVCQGTTIVFTATPVNGGTPAYQWYKNALPVGSNQATYTFVAVNGDQVYVVMTSSLTCVSGSPATSSTVTMSVIANPVATALNNGPLCEGSTLNLTGGPAGMTTYAWTGPNGFVSSLQSPSIAGITNSDAGIYTLTVTNGSGCSGSAGTTVVINTSLIATATNNGPLCEGSTLNLTGGPSGMATYAWAGPNGFTSALQNPSISNVTTAVAGTYTIVSTNSSGCSGSAVTTVVVNNSLVATASNNGPVCVGSTLNLTGGPAGMATYAWTGPNGFTSSAQNPSITNVTAAATGVYTLVATNSSGCAGTATTTATINTNPVATAANNGPVCVGSTLNLTGGPAGMTTYAWTGPNGFTSAVQNPSIVSVTTAAAGVYTLIVTNSSGCAGTVTTTATINTNPVATATNSGPVCVGSTLNLTGGPAAMTAYAWTGPNGFTSAVQNPSIVSVTTAAAGLYTLIVTNASGCISAGATTTAVVNVLPVATAANSGPVCVGSTLNLTGGPAAMTTYAWTGPNGFTSAVQSPSIASVTTAAAGAYTLIVTNANGCISAGTSTTVVVNVLPIATASNNGPVCEGSTLNLTGSPSGMTTYAWTGPNGFTANVQSPAVANITPAAAGVYTLIVTSTTGCVSAGASTTVLVNPAPVPTASNNGPLCSGSALYLVGGPPGMNAYAWSGPNGFTSNTINPTVFNVTPADAGVYILTITNALGCTGSIGTTVVIDAIQAPTAANNGPMCEGLTLNLYGQSAGATSYSWTGPNGFTSNVQNPTIANVTAAASGQYVLVVANTSGCQNSASTSVTIYAKPATTATNNGPLCAGSTLNLTGAPDGMTSYAWSGPAGFTSSVQNPVIANATTAASGVYTLLATNALGCSASANTTVVVNAIPGAPVIAEDNDVLTSSAPAGNQWYFNGALIAGATEQTYTATLSGNYYCVVTLNGCVSPQSNILYVVITGQQEIPSSASFVVYPVPNEGRFNASIQYPVESTFTIAIYNQLGSKIFELKDVKTIGGKVEKLIDLRPIPSGIYSVVFTNSELKIIRKVLVNK